MSSSSAKQRRGDDGRRGGNISNEINNSSSSIIGSNVDILTLILTRLPLKSLLVFKSVSKQWLSMITDPQFVHRHFLQNPSFSVPGLFVGEETFSVEYPNYDYISLDGNISNYIPFETLPFDDQRSSIKIVQSCNGLLLCSNLCNSWEYNKSDCTFYIFNPFTKQQEPYLNLNC